MIGEILSERNVWVRDTTPAHIAGRVGPLNSGTNFIIFEIDTGGAIQQIVVKTGKASATNSADTMTRDEFTEFMAGDVILAPNEMTPAEAGTFALQYANDIVTSGLAGTLAVQDPEVMEIYNQAWSGQSFQDDTGNFDFSSFEMNMVMTDYYQQQTARQAQWNDPTFSQADRNNAILSQAQRLMQLENQYTGQQLDWTALSTDDDLTVTIEELTNGNPELASWAERIASGAVSEGSAILEWIQPAALEIANSPYNRTLENEKRKAGERGVSEAGLAGQVNSLRERYGLESSAQDLSSWGTRMYMNEISLDELEEQFKLESQALYPNKPLDVDWNTWASPYQTAFQDVLETYKPDFRDPTLQEYLTGAEAPNLFEFKKKLRQDSRWEGTKNARDTYYRNFSLVGQKMGFM